MWVAAVVVVMGTLAMLAGGTFYLLYKECKLSPCKFKKNNDPILLKTEKSGFLKFNYFGKIFFLM